MLLLREDAMTAQFEHRLAISVFHCPNCTALIQAAGSGSAGNPWVIPDHANPADGEPCPEAGVAWTRRHRP